MNARSTRTYWELRLAWEAADNRRHRLQWAIEDGAPFTADDLAEAQAAYETARDALKAYEDEAEKWFARHGARHAERLEALP